jgi:hypothetical protein
MDRADLAIFEDEDIATPVDLVTGKAGEPDPESHKVAQRDQPQIPWNGTVMHYADSNLERYRSTEGRSCSKRAP